MTDAVNDKALAVAREQAPEPGEYVELVGGIIWLRLPIPGGLRHINVWLVPAPDGWFLVDTGMRTPAVEQAWMAFDQRLPLARELSGIVVTHHHPDHFGMARWLARRYEVPVSMSGAALAAAAGTLAGGEAASETPSDGFASRVGLDVDEAMRPILRGVTYRAIVSGTVDIPVPLDEGGVVEGAHHDWRVSLHEGHAPGHACLHATELDILISGDQVLPHISSNISLYPSNEERDPLGEFLHSLDRLAALPPSTLVLPAHGRPFATLHERISALKAEHELRLDQVLDACGEPLATAEVVAKLFNVARLDTLNRLLATTESLAHLRHLELKGVLERRGTGSALRWHAH